MDKLQLLSILKDRFEKHMERHKGINWASIEVRLINNASALKSLTWMEETYGEPDVIKYDSVKDEYWFVDCSELSPSGRRSVCYDEKARLNRKKFPPSNSAMGMCIQNGIELIDENIYNYLQTFGVFDGKSSTSWIATPRDIREKGAALFGNKHFDRVWITYQTGADSYYASRGFRAILKI